MLCLPLKVNYKTPKIPVPGQVKGHTITFTRDIAVQGLTGSVTYTAKLIAGALKGTGDVKLGDAGGGAPGGGGPTPFTATKAK